MHQFWIFAALGLTSGGAYALTATGLVTVYRGSSVLNFGQAAFGMVGAYSFWETYQSGPHWPLGVAIVFGLLCGTLLGALVYLLLMRPLAQATELTRVVVTLGLLIVIQGLATIRYGNVTAFIPSFIFPGNVTIWGASVPHSALFIAGLAIVLAIVLSLFFRRTRLGLTAIAAQERPVVTRTLGISPHPVGAITWALGGALASSAAIFLLPLTSLSPSQLSVLIYPAFAAALFGGFRKYPRTIIAAVLIGVIESEATNYSLSPGLVASIPFFVIILSLVVSGTAVPGRSYIEARMPRVGKTRRPRALTLFVVAALIIFALLELDSGWDIAAANSAIAALVGLSVVVVTGYAGQISLASYALAGISSLVTAHAAIDVHAPFPLAALLGAAAGALAGFVTGLPAWRIRGMDLAIATLGVSLIVENLLLNTPSLVGGTLGLTLPTPTIAGQNVSPTSHPAAYAITVLIVLIILTLAVINLRRGRAGRRLLSVRANERGAAALGINVAAAKVAAFTISGMLAGFAGALITYRQQVAVFSDFTVFKSITSLAFTLVGGVGFIGGAVLAGLLGASGVVANIFIGLSANIQNWIAIGGGAFLIQVSLQNPDGYAAMLYNAANRVNARFPVLPQPGWNRAKAAPKGVGKHEGATAAQLDFRTRAARGDVVLRADRITVRYGPVVANKNISFSVKAGQVLGIIGPNGAGKTTLIDAITGFARAEGDVTVLGHDVGRASVRRRARAGVGRTFQNLELFEDMTVRENLLAASDDQRLTAYFTDMAWPGSASLPRTAAAVAEWCGLTGLLDRPVMDLPQGTQRTLSIARALVAEPAALCLDEPTAGLMESERAAVVDVIRRVADEFNIAVFIVEHNLDVIGALCDELLVLDFGETVASGEPHAVLASDVVRAAYLGGGTFSIAAAASTDGPRQDLSEVER
jgi:ABC-type branched-subunit amino acid transport system ATPase component/branched-subunit amino acid ABC-type transport system permease component